MFGVITTTNGNYSINLRNGDGRCLLRSTNWTDIKYNSWHWKDKPSLCKPRKISWCVAWLKTYVQRLCRTIWADVFRTCIRYFKWDVPLWGRYISTRKTTVNHSTTCFGSCTEPSSGKSTEKKLRGKILYLFYSTKINIVKQIRYKVFYKTNSR